MQEKGRHGLFEPDFGLIKEECEGLRKYIYFAGERQNLAGDKASLEKKKNVGGRDGVGKKNGEERKMNEREKRNRMFEQFNGISWRGWEKVWEKKGRREGGNTQNNNIDAAKKSDIPKSDMTKFNNGGKIEDQVNQIVELVFGEEDANPKSNIKLDKIENNSEISKPNKALITNFPKVEKNQKIRKYGMKFKNPKARLKFTRYQLKKYFAIEKYSLPLGYLIPEVASRFLFLLMVEKIINRVKKLESEMAGRIEEEIDQEDLMSKEKIENLFFRKEEREVKSKVIKDGFIKNFRFSLLVDFLMNRNKIIFF